MKHRITNAFAEGTNSVIQLIKSSARGFRNFENYRTAILFFCGGLDLFPQESRQRLIFKLQFEIFFYDYFKADADDENDIAILERDNNKSKKVGIFSLKSKSADVKVDLPDGDYKNEISGETVTVSNGKVHCNGKAIIIRK